jgi:DNA-binding Xre family transcriptional regulator
MQNTEEVARISRLLESMLSLRKIRLSTLARELGITGGNLRRIFDGGVELKYRMILDILSYLEVAPLTFFQIAYEAKDATADALAGRLDRLRPPVEVPKVEYIERSELRSLVEETLEQLGVLEMLDKLPGDSSSDQGSASAAPVRPGGADPVAANPSLQKKKGRRRTPPPEDDAK